MPTRNMTMNPPLTFSRMILALLVVLLPSVLMAASDPAKIKEEMERIHQLDAALTKGGIPEMLDIASDKGIGAPKINSKYYAELIARQEPALAPLEQAKRTFGLNVARRLDEMAAELQRQSTSELRAEQAAQLLDLATWFETEKGYGNYFLVIRCENLAAVPLAYLTADLGFPMEKITALRNRVMPKDEEREFRKTVLNSEAPSPFIGELTGSQSERDEQMQIAWSKGWHAMSDWFQARNININHWKRSDLPESLAFFLDESPKGPKTTVESWNMDRHAGLVNGFRDVSFQNLEGFMKYRELVGKFPTEPPAWWKPDDKLLSATDAAFMNAWEPFRREHGPQYGPAALVYGEVSSGTFIDGETRIRNQAKANP